MAKRRGRGEGSIEQLPDGRWRAVLSQGIDAATGKRQRRKLYGRTKAEALAKLRAAQAAGATPDGKATLGEWLDRWLEQKRGQVQPASVAWYEARIRRAIKPTIGDVPLGKLTTLTIESMHAKLRAMDVSPSEQFKAATTLRAALRDAVRHGLIATNVAADAKKPRVDRREIRCWTAGQVQAFLAAARSDRLSALFAVAVDAGLRPGELFALHWPDVDWQGIFVRVQRSLEDLAGKLRLKAPKTLRSRRAVFLAVQTMAELARHRQLMWAEGHDVAAGPVFVAVEGCWLRTPAVRTGHFLPIIQRAGVPTIRFYDMRHTSATLLLAAGVNLKVVSERLGHESVEITLRHYVSVLPSMQSAAADAMERILGGCPPNGPHGRNGEST